MSRLCATTSCRPMGLIVTALLAEALQGKWCWHVIIDFLHRTKNINLIVTAMRDIAEGSQYMYKYKTQKQS